MQLDLSIAPPQPQRLLQHFDQHCVVCGQPFVIMGAEGAHVPDHGAFSGSENWTHDTPVRDQRQSWPRHEAHDSFRALPHAVATFPSSFLRLVRQSEIPMNLELTREEAVILARLLVGWHPQTALDADMFSTCGESACVLHFARHHAKSIPLMCGCSQRPYPHEVRVHDSLRSEAYNPRLRNRWPWSIATARARPQ